MAMPTLDVAICIGQGQWQDGERHGYPANVATARSNKSDITGGVTALPNCLTLSRSLPSTL